MVGGSAFCRVGVGGGMFVFSVEENKMLSGGRGGVNCIDARCIYAYE